MGGKDVGESNSQLLRVIKDNGLSSCVHLLGHRKDVQQLMRAIDVHASASHTEAFANVIGEAMVSGTPSVATDVGDSAWIIGDTGKVVPRGDMKALAEGITELLMMSAESRLALGSKARARIEEGFEIRKIALLYQKYFFGLGGGH
jgi:glycosyltransferase involved in cell wall biosynthesis